MTNSSDTTMVSACLARLRAGDAAARTDLLTLATERLRRLARKMLRGQFDRVGRWDDSGDVAQEATIRLWKALGDVVPESPLHFHRLAARAVRLVLLDEARRYFGPQGLGANYESRVAPGPGDVTASPNPGDPVAPTNDPTRGMEWADLHTLVQGLPDDEGAVTDLLFYQGLTQEDAADLLGVDVRTVQRRWQRARRKLGALLSAEE